MSPFNESGGVSYHMRAMRFSRSLWGDLRRNVQSWLESWPVKSQEIVLIGPSGGYTLPSQWLDRFSNVRGVEPDFVARRIFDYRLKKITWITGSVYPLEGFTRVIHNFPNSAILFCNVLGQIPLVYRKEIQKNPDSFEKWKFMLPRILMDREFASYHDIFSSQTPMLTNEACGNPHTIWPQDTTVVDHEIADLFSRFPDRQYWKWMLSPRRYHLIEGIRHTP